MRRGLLGIEGMERAEIEAILSRARDFQPVADRSFKRLDLLREVTAFKMRFYRCPWARYEEAWPGNLRLLPPMHHVEGLREDYRAMQSMLFGTLGLTSLFFPLFCRYLSSVFSVVM